MPHPLDGAREKARRAGVLAESLKEEVLAFSKRETRRVAHKGDAQTGDYVFYVEVLEETPLGWSVLVGEIIHDYRSSLDYVTWELARLNLGRDPTEDEAKVVHFPIALKPEDFKSLQVLPHLKEEHREMLRTYQPYQHGNDPAGHPLAVLKRLSDHDKHRALQITVVALRDLHFEVRAVRDCEITEIEPAPLGIALEQGVEVARVKGVKTGPEPELEGKIKPAVSVAFSDARGVLHTLDEIGTLARRVLRDFLSEL